MPAGAPLALLGALALLLPAPAEAQSVHVTNLAGTTTQTAANSNSYANAFTTGGTSTDRYTLDSVVLEVSTNSFGGSTNRSVQIWSSVSGSPGAQIGSDLSHPGSYVAGQNTFTASGITLSGGTDYFVVVSAYTLGSTLRIISSDSETGTSGWSIGNKYFFRSGNSGTWGLTGTNFSLRFRVNASVPAATLTASNKTQTGATLTIGGHSAGWWYKQTAPTAGTCTPRTAAQTTVTLTGLTAGTSYTYKAYSKTGCNTADVIATATFDTLNAQTPSPPTGFSGSGGTVVQYNSVNQTIGGSANFVNGHLLRVVYNSTDPATRLVCGAGATLEFGWYASSALTTRLGTGTISSLGSARVYVGDYTPSGGGEYQALAYCKTGTTYSTAVNLQGGNRKFTLNAPTLTVSNRTETGATLTIANHSAVWWYKQTAPTPGTCTPRTAAQTTVTLTGLTVNTSYTYKAYSKTGCNDADVIATAMFSTNLDQLPAPRLTGATPGNGQVTLAWNKVTGAAGYQYLVLNADKTRIVSTDWFSGSYGDQTSGIVTGLTNGREYHFQVRAMKRGPATRYIQWISGLWSNTRSARPEGPPPPVENIRVTHNGTSLTVTWDASLGATGYDVTYTDNSSGRTARAAWDHAGTSVTITCDSRYPGANRDCVRSGATYSVGVRAKNDRGASGWRNSGRPPTEPQPQPPSGDSCQTQLTGDGSVAGFWNERCDSAARRGRYAHYYSFTLAAQSTLTISLESRIDTYLLLRRGGQDGPILHRNDDWGGSYNSRISETLAAGTYTIEATTYHRWESGNFTLGVSGLGSTAPPQGTDPPPPVDESTAPDPVTNIRVRHNGTSLSVEWDASARATAYDVTYYDTGARRNWRAAWNRAGTRLRITCDVRPEHSDEGCINSHTYTVGIRARNAAGTSAWTNSGRVSEGGSSGSAAPAPALSVTDATAAESSGAITFAVTLSPAAARWVYVDYSTHDGTASAGLDYTAGSGTLTFRPGETRKTVTVTLLDDAYDEGSETLELMLSNAEGAPLEDGLATGTITNDDPVPQAWISRFGRTVAHQALDAVEARMDSQPLPGMTMTLAGQPVQWPNGSEQSKPVAEQVLEQFSQWVNISSDSSPASGWVRFQPMR